MAPEDPYGLERFVAAQHRSYYRALAELRKGRKKSHWMWFIFPQIAGLGFSEMSRTYAISSMAEAQAYLGHPLLGARLLACARVVAGTRHSGAERIFGDVDAQKLQSCMTLFARAAPDEQAFEQVLSLFFNGIADARTIALL